jgi:cytosine deaminase
MHEDRRHWTAQDLQRRASAALARAAANGVTHLRTHIDWFTAAAPDAWQEIARLDHPGISVERVALVPLGLFADPAAAEAIAQTVAEGGEGCLLGGFVHSSNWDPAAMENLLRSATRWRLDLDLHIDEELSDNPRGWPGWRSTSPATLFRDASAAATAAPSPAAAKSRRRRSCASWRPTPSPLSPCR